MSEILGDAFFMAILGLIILGCHISFEILRWTLGLPAARKLVAAMMLSLSFLALIGAVFLTRANIQAVKDGALHESLDSPRL